MDEEPYLMLKPKKIVGIVPKFIYTVIILIIVYFAIMYSNSLIGIPVYELITELGYEPYIVPALIVLLVISVFLSYMNLRARRYRFFDDKAEFYEGFLNINRIVVTYDKVTDITFNKSVWERIWGTGSILLNTAGSIEQELKLLYIKHPEKIYEDIQKLVKKHSGGVKESSK